MTTVLDIEVQREEAFESGKELGEKVGIGKLNQLYAKLKQLGRNEDILKSDRRCGISEETT